MKTSNKLLIVFASALILIPLLGMIIVSATQYKTGSYKDIVDVVHKVENFSTPTKDMESVALSGAFKTINIADAKRLGLYINFVKDENYGVKVPKGMKSSISVKVDEKGELQIEFNSKEPTRNNGAYITIIVYGKELNKINLNNADFVYIDAIADLLQLNAKKSGTVTLNKDITANALQINTTDVQNVELIQIAVQSLQVKMNGGDFKTSQTSYDNVSITTTGKSAIELYGAENDENYLIKNLFINTLNVADFKIENIKVEKCSGSFSDQTKVQMPAVNLNQMFKK